jgi:hypothetical protein
MGTVSGTVAAEWRQCGPVGVMGLEGQGAWARQAQEAAQGGAEQAARAWRYAAERAHLAWEGMPGAAAAAWERATEGAREAHGALGAAWESGKGLAGDWAGLAARQMEQGQEALGVAWESGKVLVSDCADQAAKHLEQGRAANRLRLEELVARVQSSRSEDLAAVALVSVFLLLFLAFTVNVFSSPRTRLEEQAHECKEEEPAAVTQQVDLKSQSELDESQSQASSTCSDTTSADEGETTVVSQPAASTRVKKPRARQAPASRIPAPRRSARSAASSPAERETMRGEAEEASPAIAGLKVAEQTSAQPAKNGESLVEQAMKAAVKTKMALPKKTVPQRPRVPKESVPHVNTARRVSTRVRKAPPVYQP